MKQFLWITAIAVTVFALSLDALAQPGRGQDGRGQGQQRERGQQFGMVLGPQQLLRNAEVVKLLELSESQTSALMEAMRPAGRGQGEAGQNPAPGTPRTPATPAERTQRTAEIWNAINSVLTANQQAKFKEIYFQANNGLNNPLLNDRSLAAMDLSAEQAAQIAKIASERPIMGPVAGSDVSDEDRAARRTANQERNNQIKAVLTADQIAKAEKLTEGAAAMRETLGVGQQQRQPGAGARQRPGGTQGSAESAPSSGAWQPGQGAAPREGGRRGNFPRNAN